MKYNQLICVVFCFCFVFSDTWNIAYRCATSLLFSGNKTQNVNPEQILDSWLVSYLSNFGIM